MKGILKGILKRITTCSLALLLLLSLLPADALAAEVRQALAGDVWAAIGELEQEGLEGDAVLMDAESDPSKDPDYYASLSEEVEALVTARPDYELGKTHYCIYGHNHPVQDLSFNRLRYTEKGDVFRLYTADTVYEYRVTRDPFPLSREEAAVLLTDNFELSAEYCYILTCGRDEHRYMDTVVEGKLQETYTAEAWKALGGKKTEKQE